MSSIKTLNRFSKHWYKSRRSLKMPYRLTADLYWQSLACVHLTTRLQRYAFFVCRAISRLSGHSW